MGQGEVTERATGLSEDKATRGVRDLLMMRTRKHFEFDRSCCFLRAAASAT
jgi:hypothetical protein